VKGYVLYELPFGRGKPLKADAGPLLNALLGGWNVSGGFRYSTGTPLRIPANVYYPGIDNVYANIVPGCDIHQHYNGQVGAAYFNPTCFANPTNGEFGDAPGYLAQLRSPGYASEDLGVSKSLSLAGDRYQMRLYFQMFNALNRHRFQGPNTQVGTADFGKVLPEDLNGLPRPRVGQLGVRLSF